MPVMYVYKDYDPSLRRSTDDVPSRPLRVTGETSDSLWDAAAKWDDADWEAGRARDDIYASSVADVAPRLGTALRLLV